MPYSIIVLIYHAITGFRRTGISYIVPVSWSQRLIDVWHSLQRKVIGAAINKWRTTESILAC